METTLIEKYDKARYKLMRWLTIGWAFWFGTYFLNDIIKNELTILKILILVFGLVGFILFFVNLRRFMRLASKVKQSGLCDALNNELYQVYRYKSFYLGFWVMLITISIFFGISIFKEISAKIVCEITLYVGVLSSLIAGLVYNKD